MRLDEGARRRAIAGLLERVGRASVADLSREFGVSTVTIRKDLSALADQGELSRVHGGATRSSRCEGGAFPVRVGAAVDVKRDIARRAAQLVSDGSVIALDSSTSAYFLAKELLTRRDLVVLTYSLPTATLLLDASSATVHLIGGVLSRGTRSASTEAELAELDLSIEIFFGGAHGALLPDGLVEPEAEEAATKKALAGLADRRYALLASMKFGREAAHRWLPPDLITGIFTDVELPDEVAEQWRGAGVGINTGR